MTSLSLEKRVAIVTGGGQGIGKGIAKRLLEEGMAVVIAEKDEEAGRETESQFQALGPIRFFRTDVTDEVSVEASVRRTRQEFGMLHALVNNAGIAHPHRGPLESVTLDDWNRMIASHLTGCFLCSKYAIRYLREARGAIVNIASTRAFQSEPDTEAYAAAKGGIVSFTHALAMSVGPEIRVNCISPGWIAVSAWKKSSMAKPPDLRPIDHTQHPVGRVGEPGDIAGLVAFLISGQSGFITGQTFIVDGGMTRKMIYAE
jgi:NAD(P)-dependent dehydrogenase (short-subunit alcohol dehydrogenase family)